MAANASEFCILILSASSSEEVRARNRAYKVAWPGLRDDGEEYLYISRLQGRPDETGYPGVGDKRRSRIGGIMSLTHAIPAIGLDLESLTGRD